MKNLIEKIGLDKIAHFFVGYSIASFINIILILQEGLCNNFLAIPVCLSGVIVSSMLGAFKEYGIDKNPDKKDLIFTIVGAIISVLPIAIGILFNILSNE